MDVNEIIAKLKNPTEEDKRLVENAFVFAREAHEGQRRYSGEDYIVHPFETAKILADFYAEPKTVAAALLHDVYEDCLITGGEKEKDEKKLEKKFGEEISFLVEGVTKLGKLKYRGEERRVESLRKMFLAMAKDIRVILIKLAV